MDNTMSMNNALNGAVQDFFNTKTVPIDDKPKAEVVKKESDDLDSMTPPDYAKTVSAPTEETTEKKDNYSGVITDDDDTEEWFISNKEVKELKINKAYVNELSNINSLLENRYIFNTNKEFNITIDFYYDIFSNKQQDIINMLLLADPNTYIYYILHDFEAAGKLERTNIIKRLINN